MSFTEINGYLSSRFCVL